MPVILKSNLGALAASLVGVMDEGSEATANDIGTLAAELAPVDTGELRDSKFVEKRGPLWVVGFSAPYAVYQEYGTARMSAQPFLTPAVRQIDLGFRYREALASAIGKAKV